MAERAELQPDNAIPASVYVQIVDQNNSRAAGGPTPSEPIGPCKPSVFGVKP